MKIRNKKKALRKKIAFNKMRMRRIFFKKYISLSLMNSIPFSIKPPTQDYMYKNSFIPVESCSPTQPCVVVNSLEIEKRFDKFFKLEPGDLESAKSFFEGNECVKSLKSTSR